MDTQLEVLRSNLKILWLNALIAALEVILLPARMSEHGRYNRNRDWRRWID